MRKIYHLLVKLFVIGRLIAHGATYIVLFCLKVPLEKEVGGLARGWMEEYGVKGLWAHTLFVLALFLIPAQILITVTSVFLKLLHQEKAAKWLPYILPIMWVGVGTLIFWFCAINDSAAVLIESTELLVNIVHNYFP